ncbi:unnamed protein product [Laminaria digitata]
MGTVDQRSFCFTCVSLVFAGFSYMRLPVVLHISIPRYPLLLLCLL